MQIIVISLRKTLNNEQRVYSAYIIEFLNMYVTRIIKHKIVFYSLSFNYKLGDAVTW